MASGVFGSQLVVKDGFSRTFESFADSITNAEESMKDFDSITAQVVSNCQQRNASMRSMAGSLGSAYRQAGMSQSESMKKAWEETRKAFNRTTNQMTNEQSRQSDKQTNKWLKGFKKVKNGMKGLFSGLKNGTEKASKSITSMIGKITLGLISVAGAKSLFSKAMESAIEYQNSRMYIDSVYGEEQGKEKFKWATKEASTTPFSESEITNSLAKAHMLGLSDKAEDFKYYEDLGSIAKINGSGDMASAVDAWADAQNGEWERLQTILGVKRTSLEKFAKENNMKKFTNKQGQVTDKEAFDAVLKKYMDTKGITGMTDKYGKTFQGRMSTMKDNISKGLKSLIGVTDEGEVKVGGLFDNLSKFIEKATPKIEAFTQSKTFEKLQDFLGKVGDKILEGFDYITNHPEVISNLVKVGVGFKLLSMGLNGAVGIYDKVTKVANIFKKVNDVFKKIKVVNSLKGFDAIKGGTLAKLLTKLSPLKGLLGGVASAFGWVTSGILAVISILNPDGLLHKCIEFILRKIPFVGNAIADGFDNWTNKIVDWFNSIADWINLHLFGKDTSNIKVLGNKEDKSSTTSNNNFTWDSYKAENGLDDKTLNSNYDITDKYGSSETLNKTKSDKAINNNTTTKVAQQPIEINNNWHISKEVDIDEVLNKFADKMDKYLGVRNAISTINAI